MIATPPTQGIGAALADSDVVIISGGVSVGPHDHVKPALDALGVQEVFWSVALQPGKPTWFGVPAQGRPLVFGLPGNPVSAVVTFSLFVAPALAALQGAPSPDAAAAHRRPGHRRGAQPAPRSDDPGAPRRTTATACGPTPIAPRDRTSSPRCSAPTRSR